ncbi:MAG: nicotinamide mononucleotide transporter [Bacteroidetes bacterium HGW-Bacteroidetes-17]|jgi:nicotinamide mononucleotide transporter|nr:MAG: nicotinamide mononucleotide transporter [Bacteroidetes bacterium HGW-Bacteroidetes-17]
MNSDNIFDVLNQNILNTTLLEIIAVFFGLLSVWYAKKADIKVYPTGIISVIIYVYICVGVKLYADMGINFVYFVMSIYGWYAWTKKDKKEKILPISFCTKKEYFINVILFFVFLVILIYVLLNYTDSNVPYWDSLTTAIFLVGMWLMARKKVENWILWIIGDAISIPLYFNKGLMLTSFQFSIFLVLAVLGYIEWKRKVKETQEIA